MSLFERFNMALFAVLCVFLSALAFHTGMWARGVGAVAIGAVAWGIAWLHNGRES